MFAVLRKIYAAQTVRKAKDFIDLAKNVVTLKERLWFLHRCKDSGIVPKSLRVKAKIDNSWGRRAADRASVSFLSAAIHGTHVKCNACKRKLEEANEVITQLMQPQHIEWIMEFRDQCKKKLAVKTHDNLVKKLVRLKIDCGILVKKNWSQDSVVNLSSKLLTVEQLNLLSYGMSFAPLKKRPPVMSMINDVEVGLSQTQFPPDVKNRMRAITCNTLQLKNPVRSDNLTVAERKALQDLRKDEAILVTKAGSLRFFSST